MSHLVQLLHIHDGSDVSKDGPGADEADGQRLVHTLNGESKVLALVLVTVVLDPDGVEGDGVDAWDGEAREEVGRGRLLVLGDGGGQGGRGVGQAGLA